MKNLPASVKQRLLNLARQQGLELQYVLSRYAIERLLYRLSHSPYGQRFTLKGATLFALWADLPQRPTWDVDLLGTGSNAPEHLEALFREVCSQGDASEDALFFPLDSIHAEPVRKSEEYLGVRIHLTAMLGTARIPVQADIGFGDAVTPAPQVTDLPVLLGHPPPRMPVYPKEAVIAEKLEAMVYLDIANSRMKDFYDVWILAQHFSFQEAVLAGAISATFQCRRTPLPDAVPTALTAAFTEHPEKIRQWVAFIKRVERGGNVLLAEVVDLLRTFLLPPIQTARATTDRQRVWPPGGPWPD